MPVSIQFFRFTALTKSLKKNHFNFSMFYYIECTTEGFNMIKAIINLQDKRLKSEAIWYKYYSPDFDFRNFARAHFSF